MVTMVSRLVPTARAIRRAIGAKRIRPEEMENLRRRDMRGELFINWGTSGWWEDNMDDGILNYPMFVAGAANKSNAFDILATRGVHTVPFTSDPAKALEWYKDKSSVYIRQLRRGFSGRGIVVLNLKDKLSDEEFLEKCKGNHLFTRYVRPSAEYRVHVFGNRVVDFTRKKRRKMDQPPPERFWVRSYRNGWVMTRNGVDLPEVVESTAVEAVNGLGLHFGAVDILYIDKGRAPVLEVNTAPGLQGTSLQTYVREIRDWIANNPRNQE